MSSKQNRLTCSQVKQVDMVSYLASLGINPAKVRGQDFWYHSPLREEKTPSFKVNRKLNCWYDFGTGSGGNLVDFAMRYHDCTIAELLQIMAGTFGTYRLPQVNANLSSSPAAPQIQLLQVGRLYDRSLTGYLYRRRIPLKIAQAWCQQVSFQMNGRNHLAIGFKNDLGGYELRNAWFKGSCSPKSPTTLPSGVGTGLAVFEGFMDMLSYKTMLPEARPDEDILVLNSLAFFRVPERNCSLYLDNDPAGRAATLIALAASAQVRDCSGLYRNHKDLNDFLCNFGAAPPGTTGPAI